jgi:hypothetical protein
MRQFHRLAAIAALALPLLTAPLVTQAKTPAQLTYSNLAPDGSYGTGYYFVAGPVNHAFTYAAPFVAGATGNLDHIDLPLNGGAIVVSIFPDHDGVPGTYGYGNALEEWARAKLPNSPGLVKFASKRNPMLTAGQKYWVVVAPLFYDSVVPWYLNSTSQIGVDATASGGANAWFEYTANGSVMPGLDVWVR